MIFGRKTFYPFPNCEKNAMVFPNFSKSLNPCGMKKINQIMENNELARKRHAKSPKQSIETSRNTGVHKRGEHFEVSVYGDDLTQTGIVENVKKIMSAFPQLEQNFYDVFQQRIEENGFTDQRLTDAVNHVIDNCIYPTPTIANFISYDRRITLYTHDQIVKKVDEMGKHAFEQYRPVKIYGMNRPLYAHLTDIEMHNLTLWNSKKRENE